MARADCPTSGLAQGDERLRERRRAPNDAHVARALAPLEEGAALAELGVTPGDHVSILSENRIEWLFADLATQALGARAVGIYQTNPTADVAYVLAHSQSFKKKLAIKVRNIILLR